LNDERASIVSILSLLEQTHCWVSAVIFKGVYYQKRATVNEIDKLQEETTK
jgi:hypothetical protein